MTFGCGSCALEKRKNALPLEASLPTLNLNPSMKNYFSIVTLGTWRWWCVGALRSALTRVGEARRGLAF